MVGFVNALAILIFLAQIPHLVDVPWLVYPMVAVGLAVIVALPRVTKAVPAPLVAIVALTAFTVLAALAVPTSATRASCPTACPPCSSRTCRSPSTPCRSSPPTRSRWRWSGCWSRC